MMHPYVNARLAKTAKTIWLGVLGGLCVSLMLMDAAPLAQTKKTEKPKDEVITLSGCVARAERTPGQYTLEDKKSGVTYRLTGTAVRDYVGQTVLIVGGSASKKLAIKGGLVPSPNVAAQAGAMDPARAAVASQGGSAGPGTVELPEFKVKSVRPVGGPCGE
jgi:hypothetical protein